MGVDTSIVMNRIKDLVIRTIISVESKVSSMMQTHVAYPQNCYECFGFDVLLDETLRPWLVEVNTSPSLSSDSPLDKSLKTKLVVELFNLVGFRQYDRKTYKKDIEERRQARLLGFEKSAGKRPISAAGGISSEQKAKRRECLVRGQSPLENLSPEDLDMIAEAEVRELRLFLVAGTTCLSHLLLRLCRGKMFVQRSGNEFFLLPPLICMINYLSTRATATCC